MNIKRAKQEIRDSIEAYLSKDEFGEYRIPAIRQRPILLMGPPGIGKTQIMEQIARECGIALVSYTITHHTRQSAVGLPFIVKKNYGEEEFSVTEYTMSEIISSVYDKMEKTGLREGILFIDEIHRFNKGQQDYLLPFVEDGTIILIGATTENPYFEVNGALLSRSIIFELKPLEQEDIKDLIMRALTDEKKGLGSYRAEMDADALEFLADMAGGDARHALNAIEIGVLTTQRSEDGKIHITLPVASECIQKRVVKYDKTGDNHYDTISAFIKSMRGSDPDAAVYYLAKMLYAGESVTFIARRMMICAAEDVGMADPNAIQVATSAALAVERVGMPEAQIILSEAVIYIATAPKSNSANNAIAAAMDCVRKTGNLKVPTHLQDSHYKGAAKLGHGLGYQYAHDFDKHYVQQQYLPDELTDSVFYEPSTMGYESKVQEHMKWLKEEK